MWKTLPGVAHSQMSHEAIYDCFDGICLGYRRCLAFSKALRPPYSALSFSRSQPRSLRHPRLISALP